MSRQDITRLGQIIHLYMRLVLPALRLMAAMESGIIHVLCPLANLVEQEPPLELDMDLVQLARLVPTLIRILFLGINTMVSITMEVLIYYSTLPGTVLLVKLLVGRMQTVSR